MFFGVFRLTYHSPITIDMSVADHHGLEATSVIEGHHLDGPVTYFL
jgi:hypothetical protein